MSKLENILNQLAPVLVFTAIIGCSVITLGAYFKTCLPPAVECTTECGGECEEERFVCKTNSN